MTASSFIFFIIFGQLVGNAFATQNVGRFDTLRAFRYESPVGSKRGCFTISSSRICPSACSIGVAKNSKSNGKDMIQNCCC
jgi:hypothetical protein